MSCKAVTFVPPQFWCPTNESHLNRPTPSCRIPHWDKSLLRKAFWKALPAPTLHAVLWTGYKNALPALSFLTAHNPLLSSPSHSPVTSMDPFSLTVGAVALVATGTDVLQSANTVRDDYCKARKQTANLRTQHVMLRENIATLSRLKSDHTAWQTSLQAIEEEFPNNIDSDSKKARLRWALKDKKKATNIVTQLKETEISTILSLQSELL